MVCSHHYTPRILSIKVHVCIETDYQCRIGEQDLPPLRGLSFLDRFLVLWIILAMALGIVLGNTVDSVGRALQKGEFVGVSIPIGMFPRLIFTESERCCSALLLFLLSSARSSGSGDGVYRRTLVMLRHTFHDRRPLRDYGVEVAGRAVV
jgi:hypothetical protein